jgi:hypothetical protein
MSRNRPAIGGFIRELKGPSEGEGEIWRGRGAGRRPATQNDEKEHKLANQGNASLGKISPGGGAAFPTTMDAPKLLHPVSAATIERLTGLKLPSDANNTRGIHTRSPG